MLTRPGFFIAKKLSINEIFHTIKLPHKKEKGVSLMLNNYYIEKMLGMKDIILTDMASCILAMGILFVSTSTGLVVIQKVITNNLTTI